MSDQELTAIVKQPSNELTELIEHAAQGCIPDSKAILILVVAGSPTPFMVAFVYRTRKPRPESAENNESDVPH